ncbi:type VI secretion system protein TssL, long form [Epibacterium sp. MM17-32]|nr:type VI secretion system protein TssL, long form [Epibacterium sp. Ofav1-8]MCG7630524.1 type VI secretion system protein TssL, long form [Epibacterium sp. MM17-32]
MERLTGALQDELETGQIELDRTNDWVLIRVSEALRFRSGSEELTSDISALVGAAARALDEERGPVRVVGHTDSVPMSGRGRFKTNEQLSEARAQTVADLLAQDLANPDRISVEGKGAVDPIADNSTREGRARNRRVEILIPREN